MGDSNIQSECRPQTSGGVPKSMKVKSRASLLFTVFTLVRLAYTS